MRSFIYSYFFQIFILIHLCQFPVALCQSLEANNQSSTSPPTLNVSPSREVHILTELHLLRKAISRRSGKPVYGGHTQLWLDGTATDGPLIIELGNNPLPQRTPQNLYAINSKDLGVANSGKPIPQEHYPDTLTFLTTPGQTRFTNAEMFDHRSGTGLIADAWMENPIYSMGTGSKPNTCYDFVEKVLTRMNLDLDPVTKNLFENSKEYYTDYSRTRNKRVSDVASVINAPSRYGTKVHTRVFDVDADVNPKAPILVYEKVQYLPSSVASQKAVNELHWEATGDRAMSVL
ncbi:MAG: hypothetical protein Q9226_002960 [Calogaya cf. arnoldii]